MFPEKLSKATWKAIMDSLIAEDGVMETCKIMLWKGDVTLSRDTELADLEPVVFSGYAASADLVWENPYLDFDTGDWTLSATEVEFRSTTGSPYVGDSAVGWALYSVGTPNVLRFAGTFDVLYTFDQPDRYLTVKPVLRSRDFLAA